MARRIEVEIAGNASSLNRAFNSSRRSAGLWNSEIVRSGRGAFAATVGFGGLGRAVAFASAQFIAFASIATVIKNTTSATVEFNDTMQKTVGLANVAQSAVAGLSDELLKMAPAVGKTPNELAKALYFVTSAGIDAAHAMDVVRVSAQAASAGLGDTQTVADALTSAINAYGQANLSAQKAADVFVATVRLGKGEADAFAPSLGNVANVASALSIKFGDLGGALAAITRLGVEPQTAAIELQQAFASLLKTTPQAVKAFRSVGLTVESLKKTLRGPTGMIGFLSQLRSHFEGNTNALAKAFPNMRAFRGILALIGKQFPQVIEVLRQSTHTAGSLRTAFGAVATDSAFKFAQLKAAVQSLGITLGEAFAPLATKVAVATTAAAEKLQAFFKRVGRQSTFTAKINVVFVGLERLTVDLLKRIAGVVAGPEGAAILGKRLTELFAHINDAARRLYETIRENFSQIRSTIASVMKAIVTLSEPVIQIIGGALVVAFRVLQAVLPPVLAVLRGIADLLDSRVGRAFATTAAAIVATIYAYTKLRVALVVINVLLASLKLTLPLLIGEIRLLGVTTAATAAAIQATGGIMARLNPIMLALSIAAGAIAIAYTLFAHKSDDVAEANKRVADSLHGVNTAARDLRGSILDLRGAHLSVQQAELEALKARKEMIRVEHDPKASLNDRKSAVLAYKSALLQLQRAQNDLINTENRNTALRNNAAKQTRNLGNTLDDLSGKVKSATENYKLLREQLSKPPPAAARGHQIISPGDLDAATNKLKGLRESYVNLAVGAQKFAEANRQAQPQLAKVAQTVSNQAAARARLIDSLLGIPPAIEGLKPDVRRAAFSLNRAIGHGLRIPDVTVRLMAQIASLPGRIRKIIPPAKAAAKALGASIASGIFGTIAKAIGSIGPAINAALRGLQKQARKDLAGAGGGGGGGGGEGGGGPPPSPSKAAKSFELPVKLQIREARAALTKTMKDDVKAWQAEVAFILRQLPKLHGKKLVEALQMLKQVQDEIAGAVKKGHKAVKDQFDVPMKIQLAEARAQAQGDDKAFRKALMAARNAARKALASGKLSIQAQIDAWNTIADINNQLADTNTGNQTKFRHLGTQAQLAALGLGGLTGQAREKAAIRQSQIGPRGSIPGRESPAFRGSGAGQQNYVINGGVNIYAPKNWREIEEELRRRSGQRHHSRRR